MAVFDMMTNAPWDVIAQGGAINDHHFTVDTASREVIHQWLEHNRHITTYAFYDGKVRGFFNIMPLTMECGKLFEQEKIQEEDLSIEHILLHDMLNYAQYAYIGAIAVKDPRNYIDRQCAAALVGCLCDLLRNYYNRAATPVTVFANSTTFEGNRIVNKLGMQPLSKNYKALKQSSIHKWVLNKEGLKEIYDMSTRYKHFIGANPWDGARA